MTDCDDCGPGPSFQVGELSPEDVATVEELKKQIASLEEQVQECALEIRRLIEDEARGGGIHAQEIFELKQKKMMLGTEIQHRKVRINLILLNA